MAPKIKSVKSISLDQFFVKVFAAGVKNLKRTDETGRTFRGVRLDLYQTRKDLKAILMAAGIMKGASWAKHNIGCRAEERCNDCIECALLEAKEQAVAQHLLYYREIPRKDKEGKTFNFLYLPEEWNPTKNVDRGMIDKVLAEAEA